MMSEFELDEKELFLFNQGTFYRSYNKFGAHIGVKGGTAGVFFTVWAPTAKSVCVAGSFNGWRQGECCLAPLGSSGVWSAFIPGIGTGEPYKYLIETPRGELLYKADPFAFFAEVRPGTASRTADISDYLWHDEGWLKAHRAKSHFNLPMNIYEVHLGSWKQHEVMQSNEAETLASRFYTYRELSEALVPYVKDMGYTHIEIMPVMEHPFDGSWGYQVTGYYAPTSRYGKPQDFMYFIDACHNSGIGVILDWVPGHFCRDAHGLGRFVGDKLYEISDHIQWGTHIFDFGRSEVKSFLLSNALFWLDKYHIDGIRVDGVSSMLYLNYGVPDGAPRKKNSLGGEENLEAVSFLKEFNRIVGEYFPGVFTAAEESTSWPLVTYPPDKGGLGFHYKWDMGWMNDTLKYMSLGFPERSSNQKLLTFGMMYSFSENFILPLSHDEVVHGKHSLIERMPGDYWRQFAGLRLLSLYQLCRPGAKLNFMGNEFGQFIEWRFYDGLDWLLLGYETHRKHKDFIKALNILYREEPALWEINYDWRGFKWIDADNSKQSILIFMRRAEAEPDFIIAVFNFKPETYKNFRIGVPFIGKYIELINSDEQRFGGSGKVNSGMLMTHDIPMHGQKQSLEITVPPLGGALLKPFSIEYETEKSQEGVNVHW